LFSHVSGGIYRSAAKPLLFRQKPDSVHSGMVKASRFLQKTPGASGAIRRAWSYQNTDILSRTIHGVYFPNPVGLSAGFDANFELVPTLKAIGFGFMEGGSLTFWPCVGNPHPWFYRLPGARSLVVNKGLANQGVEAIIKRIKAYPEGTFKDFPLNISVAKTNSKEASTDDDAVADYIGSLRKLQAAKVGDMITLNISCPNTYGGEPFTTPARLERLLVEVDKVSLTQPVFVKMPADLDWEDFDGLLRVIVRHTVAGVTISNLTKRREPFEAEGSLPKEVQGKLSGKPTFEASNRLIAKTYRNYGHRLTIIGVGGVFTAQDAYTKIKLGASLVELITGMVYEGPQLIGQINRGLVELLKRDGFKHVSDAVGKTRAI
jgi:dihydroorotate dehydrogenase